MHSPSRTLMSVWELVEVMLSLLLKDDISIASHVSFILYCSHETFKEANLADSSMAREDASFLTTLHH